MSLIELGPVIFGPTLGVIQFLQHEKLLAGSMMCQHCNINMDLQTRDQCVCSDGYSWRCPDCYTFRSVRHGSFFSKSRLPLYKWLLFMYKWSVQNPVTEVADEVEVTEKTAIQIYQYFRTYVLGDW